MMNVATALNKKYIPYTGVMLTSLCMNNQREPIRVFLFHHELEDEDIRKLEECLESYDVTIVPKKIDRSLFDDRIFHGDKWSMEAYYRLLMFDVLPEDMDRLLYLDVDMIVNRDIGDFYYRDFGNKNLVVCENTGGYLNHMERLGEKQKEMLGPMFEKGFRYFNSGMLLIRFDRMVKEYSFDTYVEAMKAWDYQMTAPDQDLLNYLHWDQVIYEDDEKYNFFSRIAHEKGIRYEDGKQKLGIIHFTDEKPWESKNYHYPIEKIWWDYAKETPFYREIWESFLDKTMMHPKMETWIRDLMQQVENVNAQLGKSLELIEQLMAMVPGQ